VSTSEKVPERMQAAFLPGDSTVTVKDVDVPEPGHGQVLLKVKASTICGSDVRAIYHEHLGSGPEGYQGVVAGHEPSGLIVKEGPGLKRFRRGDRVIVYHISGCGVCNDCRRGYMISCTSEHRAAYGWQRDGGMAPYLLADEKDLVALPDELSYLDGAQVACGFGTVYEALTRIGVSGDDAVLVVGLGPVGLAALLLAKALGAEKLIGVDVSDERLELARQLGLTDHTLKASETTVAQIRDLTGGHGVERALDASGSEPGRRIAVQATRKWGKVALVGEGSTLSLEPSPELIHDQKTVCGSWVTSIWRMEELVERLVRWRLHPEDLVTHKFALAEAGEAYALMSSGRCGKVAVVF